MIEADLEARLGVLLAGAFAEAQDVSVTALAPLTGGNARRAWSFMARWTEGGELRQRPCVLLVQSGPRQLETDVGWEYRVLRALEGAGLRAPAAIAADEDGTTLGAPCVVLEWVEGASSARDLLRGARAVDARPVATTRLIEDLAHVAAGVHDVDWQRAGLGEGAGGTAPADVAARQVTHWEQAFLDHRLEPHPVLASLFGWLHDHLPEPGRISLVHGDLRPGNFLYQEEGVTALLDWEMVHLGDPVEDLAWVYRPLWSPARFLSLPDFLAAYARHGGGDVPAATLRYYRVFSEVKFATISLTGAHAFATGRTSNIRLADRATMVTHCLQQALEWVEQDTEDLAHA